MILIYLNVLHNKETIFYLCFVIKHFFLHFHLFISVMYKKIVCEMVLLELSSPEVLFINS